MKRCSENMQQIYRRTPAPKCGFNKVAGCYPVNLMHISRTPFLKNTLGRLLLWHQVSYLFSNLHVILTYYLININPEQWDHNLAWVCSLLNLLYIFRTAKNIPVNPTAICKSRHWNLGIGIGIGNGIGIGTDITNVIISSSIRPMDPKISRVVT